MIYLYIFDDDKFAIILNAKSYNGYSLFTGSVRLIFIE